MSVAAIAVTIACALGVSGCKKKVTEKQCGEILDRYAELVVRAKLKSDASPDLIAQERARERQEAQADDDFRNCAAELSAEEYACAMSAQTADALEKCLE